MPVWILACSRPRGAWPRRFLRDVLWGQYCLFLFVRIHDDIIDGQARDRRLIFIADDLLVESRRSFARHFSDGRFDALCDEYLRATLRAILEVDGLQSRAGAMTVNRVDLYARVSAVFKVAAAAVCLRSRREDLLPVISQFYDRLAIASQLVDDLFDLDEDLKRGRYSVAANVIFDGAGRRRQTRGPDAGLARSIVVNDSIGRLLSVARRQLDHAVHVIRPLRIDPATEYAMEFRNEIERLAGVVHRARVHHVFGTLC